MTYIIVILDTFSRWIELYAAPNAKATSACKAMYQHFGRYGAPEQVLTDKGPQYTAALVDQFCKLVGTDAILTKAYSKEENGSVERANQEVMRYVRALCYDRNTKAEWSNNLPIVQRIHNSLQKEVTGFSPAELLFGSSLFLSRNLFQKDVEAQDIINTPINEWLATRASQQLHLLETARIAQEKYDQDHTDSLPTAVTSYDVGNYVLKDYPRSVSGANGRPDKLHTNSKGPYKIIKKLSDQEYILQDANNRILEPVSVHLLRPYRYDAARTDPSKEGYKDNESWEVEEVLSHTGKGRNPRHWKFLVKWAGYSEDLNSEEVWANLIHNECLHKYLAARKLTSFIPKKHMSLDRGTDSGDD